MKHNIRFYTETAVSNYNGKTDFYTDTDGIHNNFFWAKSQSQVTFENVIWLANLVLFVIRGPKIFKICLNLH